MTRGPTAMTARLAACAPTRAPTAIGRKATPVRGADQPSCAWSVKLIRKNSPTSSALEASITPEPVSTRRSASSPGATKGLSTRRSTATNAA